jgi:hypothetical protein
LADDGSKDDVEAAFWQPVEEGSCTDEFLVRL